MQQILLFIFLVICCFSTISSAYSFANNEVLATVFYTNDSVTRFYIKEDTLDKQNGVAYANYRLTLESQGWDTLEITTNNRFDDEIQAFAAGYLEGYITNKRISDHYANMNTYTWYNEPNKRMPEYVREFFLRQREWVKNQSLQKKDSDPVWKQIYLIYLQMDGLLQGYNNAVRSNSSLALDYPDIQVLNSFGDLFDIMSIKKERRPNFKKMTSEQVIKFSIENGHCSSIWKVAPDLSDIYFGHSSWFTFSAMTRIFKTYTFPFNAKGTNSKTVTFSSYPANIGSNDDFYVTSGGLAVIETSNNIFNTTLYDYVKPESLLCWQRVILANRMATSAPEWAKYFSLYNSGTYNNQYQVLDYKLFKPYQPLPKDLFWIVEQIPGYVEAGDQTPILAFGYWPSYNVAFYKYINEISGYPEMAKKPGAEHVLSYQSCARANIFRRDQTKVSSIDTLKKLLRYNDFKSDPLSLKNPAYAICSRYDLEPVSSINERSCSGGYDTKLTSVNTIQNIHIINGPTYDDLPAFEWNGQCSGRFSHQGQPQKYQFSWMKVNWLQ
ncbi:hypothetical protein ABK040_009542 [Willaertia magna]